MSRCLPDAAQLPAVPGTYVLVLEAERAPSIRVGRLGRLGVEVGHYLYVGSALGPGGLRGRLARHLGRSAKLHWHVDALRRVTELREVWLLVGKRRREHAWARCLERTGGLSVPLVGFGSSDCRCPTHLFFSRTAPSFAAWRRSVGAAAMRRLRLV